MVVRLRLKTMRRQTPCQVRPQKGHDIFLVRVSAQPHPYQMNVIRHQAIDRAEKPFPRGRVQEQLAEFPVERFVQPAGAPIKYRQCPMDDGVALIEFPLEAR